MKKVFLFSECDYIAANTLEEAIDLYENEGGLYGSELDEAIENVEEVDEQGLTGTIINFPIEEDDPEADVKYEQRSLLDFLKEADPEDSNIGAAFWLISIEP